MKVVVTGGAGFIGSHLADALCARGDEVHVIDDLSTGARENVPGAVALHELDIGSEECRRLIGDLEPAVIVHQAAQMSVARSVRDPRADAMTNLIGGLSVLGAAVEVRARVLFASTGGALYGDADMLPTPETYPAWPLTPYGVAKLAFEHYLHSFRVIHGLRSVALRYANVYGPRQNPHGEAGVVAIFSKAISEGRPHFINGDGRQTRDYIHVADVVRANLAALDHQLEGRFNVGTGRQTDVNTIHGLIASALGWGEAPVHRPAVPEQRTSALDSSALTAAAGWRPQVALEEGLAETARWFRDRSGRESSVSSGRSGASPRRHSS